MVAEDAFAAGFAETDLLAADDLAAVLADADLAEDALVAVALDADLAGLEAVAFLAGAADR